MYKLCVSWYEHACIHCDFTFIVHNTYVLIHCLTNFISCTASSQSDTRFLQKLNKNWVRVRVLYWRLRWSTTALGLFWFCENGETLIKSKNKYFLISFQTYFRLDVIGNLLGTSSVESSSTVMDERFFLRIIFTITQIRSDQMEMINNGYDLLGLQQAAISENCVHNWQFNNDNPGSNNPRIHSLKMVNNLFMLARAKLHIRLTRRNDHIWDKMWSEVFTLTLLPAMLILNVCNFDVILINAD